MSSLTATYDAAADAIRLVVDVSDLPGPPATAFVYRDATGTVAVRNGEPARLTGGIELLDDHEAPRDLPLKYRAVVGSTTISSATISQPSLNRVKLVHPGKPSLSVELAVAVEDAPDLNPQVSVYQPLDREEAITIGGGLGAETSGFTAYTLSNEDRLALRAIFRDTSPLFLAAPPTWIDQGYIQFTGISPARVQPMKASEESRAWKLDFVRCARPSGLAAAEYTFDDVRNTYATFAALLADNTSFFDVLDGPG